MKQSDVNTESATSQLQSLAQSEQGLKDIIAPVEPVIGLDWISIFGLFTVFVLLVWLILAIGKRSQWFVWVNWIRKQKKQLRTQDTDQQDQFQAWLWQTAAELHNFQQASEKMQTSQHFMSTSAQKVIDQWQIIAFQDLRSSGCEVSRETVNGLLDELHADAWKSFFHRPVKNKGAA